MKKFNSLTNSVFFGCLIWILFSAFHCHAQDSRPNVIIVITDDQGYGDLGCHGNEIIKTPNLDQFYKESVRLTDFHVSPTCAPSRGALMTGRYTNRIGTWHTIAGRSQLFSDETTLAQLFAVNGYKTGLFGKWHLGDNYPFRPIDRGFQEVITHGGGGIGQGPDYWGNDYFDDTYRHNGQFEKYDGYCTDVFFENALSFIENHKEEPFFLYISTNAPHSPMNVPEEYYNMYKDEDSLLDSQKRMYGMITNIDDNFKLLEDKLVQLDLKDNTIVIFMTDNGSGHGIRVVDGVSYGFDGGMRAYKGSEYEGGHRVPFFIRWPDGDLGDGRDIQTLAAHIDIFPTLEDLCDLKSLPGKPLDGKSIKPLLYGQPWPWIDRVLITDSQRHQNLIKWRKSAVMQHDWRLVNGRELYNVKDDPKQTLDVADEHPEVVKNLQAAYESWWASINADGVNERYAYIQVGSRHENPARINAHDMHVNKFDQMWHQVGALKGARALGLFKIEFVEAGEYRISLCRYPRESGYAINEDIPAIPESIEVSWARPESKQLHFSKASLFVGDFLNTKDINSGDKEVTFDVFMQQGKYDMKAILIDDHDRKYPAYYIYVEKK